MDAHISKNKKIYTLKGNASDALYFSWMIIRKNLGWIVKGKKDSTVEEIRGKRFRILYVDIRKWEIKLSLIS